MKKKFNIGTTILIALLCSIITFTATYSVAMVKFKNDTKYEVNEASYITKLKQVDKLIRSIFVGKIDDDYLSDKIIEGYINGLNDKYSRYYSIDEMSAYMDSLNSELIGIGVYVVFDETIGGIYITGLMPDSPALNAGMQIGDVITKVEDIELSAETYYEALAAVPGKEGEIRKIEIKRAPDYDQPIKMEIEIKRVTQNTVNYQMLDNSIALIEILQFNTPTAEEFKQTLDKALEDGAKKFIFDVRNNPGGALDAIVDVLDRILPDGPIVRIVSSDGSERVINSSNKQVLDAPIVVLVNKNTASAAELFSSALRDYKIATIIGETTYGKGTMQSIRYLSDGSGVSISTNMYNPPYGDNYEGIGVIPHIEVKLTQEQLSNYYKLTVEEDPQIQAAIKELQYKD